MDIALEAVQYIAWLIATFWPFAWIAAVAWYLTDAPRSAPSVQSLKRNLTQTARSTVTRCSTTAESERRAILRVCPYEMARTPREAPPRSNL